MRKPVNNTFINVIKREIIRMCSRPYYYLVTILLPLFSIFFMSTIFNNGQMVDIPVGVVDLDNSSLSRELIRDFSAVPTFNLKKRYDNAATARDEMVKKDIYAYMVIPYEYSQKVNDGKNVSLCFYYHYALLSVGGEVLSGFKEFVEPVVASPVAINAFAAGMTQRETEEIIAPADARFFSLFNPDLNYAIYLSSPFCFIFLQVIILIVSLYITGIEIKNDTAKEWLETAGGNIYIAIFGKYLPYTIVYSVIMIFANFVMFYLFDIPHSSTLLPINIVSIILVMASQALGIFIFSLLPVLGLSISIVSMIGSLGATLSGLTFPVPSMYPAIRIMSSLLPVRHFTLIYQNLVYGDHGFIYSWQNYLILAAFMLLPLLTANRLKSSILNYKLSRYE